MKCRLSKLELKESEFGEVEFPEGALLVASVVDERGITIYFLEPVV